MYLPNPLQHISTVIMYFHADIQKCHLFVYGLIKNEYNHMLKNHRFYTLLIFEL
jgi:hypothetical protein